MLRHRFGTLMKANGEEVKTMQETLGHADVNLTTGVYTQAAPEVKRIVHNRVVRQLIGGSETEEEGER